MARCRSNVAICLTLSIKGISFLYLYRWYRLSDWASTRAVIAGEPRTRKHTGWNNPTNIKPWLTEDSSTPFFHYHLLKMLSQCTKESREEVLRFPASLRWRTRCLYSIIDKGSRLQFTLIFPWTLCLLDYISSCSKISFTILHRAFRLLQLDSKDQS